MKSDTPVTFSPLYPAWYRATTGNKARHDTWDGWQIDRIWNGRSRTSQRIRAMLGDTRPGEMYAGLVCMSNDWRNGTRVNLPLRFVERVGQCERIIQLRLWSEAA